MKEKNNMVEILSWKKCALARQLSPRFEEEKLLRLVIVFHVYVSNY